MKGKHKHAQNLQGCMEGEHISDYCRDQRYKKTIEKEHSSKEPVPVLETSLEGIKEWFESADAECFQNDTTSRFATDVIKFGGNVVKVSTNIAGRAYGRWSTLKNSIFPLNNTTLFTGVCPWP